MKRLVLYGLILIVLGVVLHLLPEFGMDLGISWTLSGLPFFPLLALVVLGAVVTLYGFIKK